MAEQNNTGTQTTEFLSLVKGVASTPARQVTDPTRTGLAKNVVGVAASNAVLEATTRASILADEARVAQERHRADMAALAVRNNAIADRVLTSVETETADLRAAAEEKRAAMRGLAMEFNRVEDSMPPTIFKNPIAYIAGNYKKSVIDSNMRRLQEAAVLAHNHADARYGEAARELQQLRTNTWANEYVARKEEFRASLQGLEAKMVGTQQALAAIGQVQNLSLQRTQESPHETAARSERKRKEVEAAFEYTLANKDQGLRGFNPNNDAQVEAFSGAFNRRPTETHDAMRRMFTDFSIAYTTGNRETALTAKDMQLHAMANGDLNAVANVLKYSNMDGVQLVQGEMNTAMEKLLGDVTARAAASWDSVETNRLLLAANSGEGGKQKQAAIEEARQKALVRYSTTEAGRVLTAARDGHLTSMAGVLANQAVPAVQNIAPQAAGLIEVAGIPGISDNQAVLAYFASDRYKNRASVPSPEFTRTVGIMGEWGAISTMIGRDLLLAGVPIEVAARAVAVHHDVALRVNAQNDPRYGEMYRQFEDISDPKDVAIPVALRLEDYPMFSRNAAMNAALRDKSLSLTDPGDMQQLLLLGFKMEAHDFSGRPQDVFGLGADYKPTTDRTASGTKLADFYTSEFLARAKTVQELLGGRKPQELSQAELDNLTPLQKKLILDTLRK